MGGYHNTYLLLRSIRHLKEAVLHWKLPPQDYSDVLAGHMAVCMFTIMSGMLSLRLYFYNAIDCLIPAEWPSAWEEASEAYCFTTATYAVPINISDPSKEMKTKTQLNYYYYLPFILVGFAMIFKIPDLMWQFIAGWRGRVMTEMLTKCQFIMISDFRKVKSPNARAIHRKNVMRDNEKQSSSVSEMMMQQTGIIDFSSAFLLRAFVITKFLRICTCIVGIVLLQQIFSLSTPMFGPTLYRNISSGNDWNETLAFPRIVFCDVRQRNIRADYFSTIQCVLPINMLNEKMCIIIWFYVAATFVLLLLFSLKWILRMIPSGRRKFVKELLHGNSQYEKDFLDFATRFDRMLLLYLASDDFGSMVSECLLERVLHLYEEKRKAERNLRENITDDLYAVVLANV